MGSKLYVGNLSYSTTEQDLEKSFSEYGKVTSATVVKDRETDRSRGFGFVEFVQSENAKKAKAAMNGKELNGRSLKVNEAKPVREKSRSFGGYNRRERNW